MAQFLMLFAPSEAYGFSRDSLSQKQVWLASQVLPGSGQFINRQYWKMPVFYAGMGSLAYLTVKTNGTYRQFRADYRNYSSQPYYGPEELAMFQERYVAKRMERNLYYAGMYALYVTSIADALIVNAGGKHSPTTAAVLSALMPGMGQVYNQKQWKVPIIYAGFGAIYYMFDMYHRGYTRFRMAYQYQTDNNDETFNEISLSRSRDEILYFKNAYQRNRDLMVIIIAGFYVLNIIDANVDAHFFDWDISSNLAYRFEPFFDRSLVALNSRPIPTAGIRFCYTF